jgi:perosamine synthetase
VQANTIAYELPGRAINLPSYHEISSDDLDRVVSVVGGLYTTPGIQE